MRLSDVIQLTIALFASRVRWYCDLRVNSAERGMAAGVRYSTLRHDLPIAIAKGFFMVFESFAGAALMGGLGLLLLFGDVLHDRGHLLEAGLCAVGAACLALGMFAMWQPRVPFRWPLIAVSLVPLALYFAYFVSINSDSPPVD